MHGALVTIVRGVLEKRFVGGCAEGGIAGGGMSRSDGETSVELDDLRVNLSVKRLKPFW